MKFLEIIKDPEHFILDRYYMSKMPDGFRLEIFLARGFHSFCDNTKQFASMCSMSKTHRLHWSSLQSSPSGCKGDSGVTTKNKKVFCQFCEKHVVPRRTHKLDFADIVLVLFTGGFWAIFIFVLYLFMRRCPVCNISLRGLKPVGFKKSPK